MIPFHKLSLGAAEMDSVAEAMRQGRLGGDGEYCKSCERELALITGAKAAMLTCSGSAALEMAALLLNIAPHDEIIMPSFTFPSTANAFALRGARPVFVDIRPGDMNIDAALIEDAITPATRAVVAMHYGGAACDMQAVTDIAQRHRLDIIEDAALGLLAYHHDRPLGTIGRLGCLSFHHSKHFSMGEGGALLINDPSLLGRAEMLRQKGTDSARFHRGEISYYCWQDIGSSYAPSELNAACLLPQLRRAGETTRELLHILEHYQRALTPLVRAGHIELPAPAPYARHNGHIYFIKTKDNAERERLAAYLKQRGIATASHYQPLHTAPAGRRLARFHGEDRYTSRDAARLLRLPLWRGLSEGETAYITKCISEFYAEGKADE